MAEQRHDESSRGFTRTASATLALGCAFLLWLVSDVGSPRAEVLVSDVVFLVAPLFAAWTCWRAHRRDRRPAHTGWWWISMGCLTWAAGSLCYLGYQVVLGPGRRRSRPWRTWATSATPCPSRSGC